MALCIPWTDTLRCATQTSKALAKTAEEVPYEERIKALCMLMGVGAIKAADVSQPALAAARASIQTGLAFESSVYADAIDVYV